MLCRSELLPSLSSSSSDRLKSVSESLGLGVVKRNLLHSVIQLGHHLSCHHGSYLPFSYIYNIIRSLRLGHLHYHNRVYAHHKLDYYSILGIYCVRYRYPIDWIIHMCSKTVTLTVSMNESDGGHQALSIPLHLSWTLNK